MIILLFIPQSILLVVIGCSGPISILRCVVAIFWINIWHALQKQKNCAIKYFTNEQTEIQSKGRGKGSKQKRIWTNKIKKNVMRATWFEHATIGPGIRRSAVGATPPQLVLPIFLFWITSPVMIPFERVIFLFRFAILIFTQFGREWNNLLNLHYLGLFNLGAPARSIPIPPMGGPAAFPALSPPLVRVGPDLSFVTVFFKPPTVMWVITNVLAL